MQQKVGLKSVKVMCLVALLSSFTIVITAYLPIPLTAGGYLNFSDFFIILGAILVNPFVGACVGAIGGAIADILAGYAVYAPFTAIIKAVEALVAGYLYLKVFKGKFKLIAPYIGGIIMGCLYFFVDFMLYSLSGALANLPFNLLQGVVNATLVIMFFPALKPVQQFIGLNEPK